MTDRPQPLSEEEIRELEEEGKRGWPPETWLIPRLLATLHAERERAEMMLGLVKAGAIKDYPTDEPLVTVSKADWEKAEAVLRRVRAFGEEVYRRSLGCDCRACTYALQWREISPPAVPEEP